MIQMLVIRSIVSKIQGCRKLFYGKRDGRVGGDGGGSEKCRPPWLTKDKKVQKTLAKTL